MTKHTTRDRIWSASLETAEEYRDENTTWSGFTAADVADRLENGASQRSIRDTLATMADLGHLERHRKRGQYEPVARDVSAAPKERKDASGPTIEASSTSTTSRNEPMSASDAALALEDESDQETLQESEEVDVDDLDLPGAASTLEAREQAVRACYEYLCENETATKTEFIRDVRPDHGARYASDGGWWNTIGKKGLRELARRRDDIEAPAEGGHIWRYTG